MLKKYGFSLIAVIALVIAVISFFPQSRYVALGAIGSNAVENYIPVIKYNDGYYSELSIQTTGTSTSATTTATQVTAGVLSVSGISTLTGSTTISGDYYSIGDIEYASGQISLNTGSTTLCSVPNPFGNATSTLEQFILQITTGTSTASTIDIGASLNLTSTSSALFVIRDAVASGAQDTIVMPALPSTATSTVISPLWHVVAKTNEVGLAGYTYGGTCSYVFMKP